MSKTKIRLENNLNDFYELSIIFDKKMEPSPYKLTGAFGKKDAIQIHGWIEEYTSFEKALDKLISLIKELKSKHYFVIYDSEDIKPKLKPLSEVIAEYEKERKRMRS